MRVGTVISPLVNFMQQHKQELLQKRVALFAVHTLNRGNTEEDAKKRNAFFDPVFQVFPPDSVSSIGFFAGKVRVPLLVP